MIRILANGHQLDFVKETLTLRDENNAVSSDFKVTHTSFPFLIVENEACLLGLGTRDITSVHKKKMVPVIVYEGENQYYGELQIMSYLAGYRKCNLKYATELLTVFGQKIAKYMPTVSVIPDEPIIPYSKEGLNILPGTEEWWTYPLEFIDKSFPEVKWQFPLMNWKKKFGEKLNEDDPWFTFKNIVNNYEFSDDTSDPTVFLINGYDSEESPPSFEIYNYNVASPQVYLLAPLFYVLEAIGFKAVGSFMESDFAKKILMFTEEDNMISTYPSAPNVEITFNETFDGDPGVWVWSRHRNITRAGRYVLHYSFTEASYTATPGTYNQKYLLIRTQGNWNVIRRFIHLPGMPAQTYTGSVELIVDESMLNDDLNIKYFSGQNVEPTYWMELEEHSYQPLMQMHPTIELARYVPDWTFGEYLNQLKKKFGLDISIDDFKKQVSLNFAEDFIRSEAKFVSQKSLKISAYDPEEYTAYHLRNSNDVDTSLFITKDEVAVYTGQVNSFTQETESKFKFMPVVGNQLEVTDDIANREGVGLFLYDPANAPYPTESIDGFTLAIDGDKGLFETCHKLLIKTMLSGSVLEATGPFDTYELSKIRKLKKISIDHQAYIVQSTQSTQVSENIYMVKMRLISVNY